MTDEYDRIRIRDLTNDLAAAVARAERAERERDEARRGWVEADQNSPDGSDP